MKGVLKRLRMSPAMVVAMIALFVALSGTAVATTSVLITGKQIKNGSITGADIKNKSVPAAKLKGNFRGARGVAGAPGPVGPQGPQGPQGPKGDTGTVDTSNFYTKADSDGRFEQRTCCAASGQVMSGQISEHYAANEGFWLGSGTFQNALPPGTPIPTLEYRPGTTTSATCPGIGQATAGRLCVYGYNTSNFSSMSYGGNISGGSHRFGFGLDLFPTASGSNGYIIANWAYRVP